MCRNKIAPCAETAQITLAAPCDLHGVGLHRGQLVRLRILPAPADHGIRFVRTDLDPALGDIPARYDLVSDTSLNTTISNDRGASVSTIEHLMAALVGTGIHNARVEIDGPEVPILDGSALPFAKAILATGRATLDAPLRFWRVVRPVALCDGPVSAQLLPFNGMSMRFEIAFEDGAIGMQSHDADLANGAFLRELADCRTFCRMRDVEAMRAQGLALGGSFSNAVVVEGGRVLSPGGFRRRDECVRHKMLDAVGDLALAGLPILGRFKAIRGGHGLTNRLLRAAFATPGCLRIETATAQTARLLPGTALGPADLAAVG